MFVGGVVSQFWGVDFFFFAVIGLVDSAFIPMFVGGVETLAVPLFSAAASLWQVLLYQFRV
jgi:hypothetical protein